MCNSLRCSKIVLVYVDILKIWREKIIFFRNKDCKIQKDKLEKVCTYKSFYLYNWIFKKNYVIFINRLQIFLKNSIVDIAIGNYLHN